MCNFLSWLECEGKTYVITDAEVKSEKGKELIKESGSTQDIWGHGFCRRFYGLTNAQGVEKEVANVWGKEILNKEIKALVKNLNRNFGYMFSLGGYLDLSILTSLPKNVQFPKECGSLDLSILTSLPKNVQFPKECGYLYLPKKLREMYDHR